MATTLQSILVVASALAVTFLVQVYLRRRTALAARPPGPTPLPFLGNVFDIPVHAPWKMYAAWGKKYRSDLISVQTFCQLTIVVNSAKAARKLFEKRSHNYSDRPHFTMIDLLGWDWDIAMLPYGGKWRVHRRLMHQFMNEKAAAAYHPVISNKVHTLLKGLHGDPEHYRNHIAQFLTSVTMSIAYAYDDQLQVARHARNGERAGMMFANVILPGAALVNTFPFLKYLPVWLPGAGFLRDAKHCKLLTTQMREEPLEAVKADMHTGTAGSSMASTMIEANEANQGGLEGMEALKNVAAIVYAGGADTTTSVITTFVLAMSLNPSVQRRAQDAIDTVVGRYRLPTLQDREQLPYIEAICREVLRWHPVTPLGLPRKAIDDDEYNGFLIPGGTTLIFNTWAILHDPEVYPEPELFKPERFFAQDGSLSSDDAQPAFGFGRRICAGIPLARATVWLAVASILANFNISPAKDDRGNDILIEVEYSSGAISHSAPFRCSFTPRDAKATELLREPNVF